MRALRVNHVSLSALDLEASVRFYVELFGAEPIPTPRFPGSEVRWLQLGEQQLHLFAGDAEGPLLHHVGIDVDDFQATFLKVRALGALDTRTFGSSGLRRLPDGAVQMYVRDPAGNLVEVDWPDAATLDPAVVGEIERLEDQCRQDGEARRARLYRAPAAHASP